MINLRFFLLFLSCLLFPRDSFAHIVSNSYTGFYEGFIHPITGVDHLLAIFFVGILASQGSQEKAWRLPVLFIASMFFGGCVGITHIHLPLVEVMISLSLVVIGLLLTLHLKVIQKLSFILISLFAFFHGHAHSIEASPDFQWLIFEFGFIIATATLLAGGFYLGKIIRQSDFGPQLLNYSGVVVALIGVVFLTTITLS